MSYSKETIQSARQKYLSGQSDDEIAKTLNIAPRTVRNWRIDQNWDLSQGDYVERLRAKVLLILGSENPNQGQLALAEKLNNQILSHERALAKQSQKSQANQGKGGRHKSKNSFEGINLDDIKEPSLGRTKPKDHKIARGEKPFFYRFQQAFIKDEAFVRFVLKSRQLGFSWVVAWEALWDALKTGKNKIFLSASKKQVGQIRSYIRKLAKSVFGVTLVGTDCITITNPAGEEVEFHFLSTNCVTAQSFHGDVYIDEACWIPKFRDLLDVALAMAIQDDYRVTYVSTPSTKSHHSYRIWAGLDDDDKPIKDEISRHSITLDQAIKEGYDRISWKKIKKQFRYTNRQIAFLFRCKWVEDTGSLFKIRDLERCWYREAVEDPDGGTKLELADLPEWKKQGNRVYAGFDPNGGGENGDSASLFIGEHRPDKFRKIKHYTWANQSINFQLARIKRAIVDYRINRLEIDTSGGYGQQIYNMLGEWARGNVSWPFELSQYKYTQNSKEDLVWHLERIIAAGQFEFEQKDSLLMQSFASIKMGATARGNKPTIYADRSKNVGHADLFWALAHAARAYPITDSPLKHSKGVGSRATRRKAA